MTSLNKVQIIGNVGRDPEIRTFPNGGKVANLSVATSEKWKDRNSGERRERTEWHNIAVFVDPTIRFIEQYVSKGDMLYIEGKLETRKWQDQSGQDRYTTEIVVRPYSGEVKKLKEGGSGQRHDSGGYGSSDGGGGYSSGGGGGQGVLDDEIPFAPEWRI